MLSKKKPPDKVDPEYLVGLDTASAQPAPAGVKPFIQKYWKPIIAVVCAAVVAAAVLVPKNSAKPAAASAQYVETRPEKRNIVNSYSADGTITYPVTIRIDDTGSLMPGMNATAALDIPPCRRYVIVKATAGFAVFRLILKSLLFIAVWTLHKIWERPIFV